MTLRENIRDFWFDMSLVQRVAVLVISVVIAGWILGMTVMYLRASLEVKRLEWKAGRAEAEKNELLAEAAKVASEIRRREEELVRKEAVIDEEYKRLPAAVQRRVDAERDLDGVRANPRADAPTADELCQLLANAGHPCG